mmetsp:Transcript_26464/g.47772  ORF Transcript_26464/g.47772 Transcript_26464/m.47772 type:complete len:101 (-) Transcript_26464:8-310(-)
MLGHTCRTCFLFLDAPIRFGSESTTRELKKSWCKVQVEAILCLSLKSVVWLQVVWLQFILASAHFHSIDGSVQAAEVSKQTMGSGCCSSRLWEARSDMTR